MTGDDAVKYLENAAKKGTRLGLERIRELLCLLGNPEKNLRFIHIAGTNGKGSAAAFLYSVLQKAGYKTGAFTSPILTSFYEQISFDGKNISPSELGQLTETVKNNAEKMTDPPTEFEMVTAIAFLYFKKKECDFVVLEVGMGGRLDSTNVIAAPEVAVILNIGLDHTKELGRSINKIAEQKAGIIKDGCDVVCYEQSDKGVRDVIEDSCKQKNARLKTAEFSEIKLTSNNIDAQIFSYREYKNIKIRLLGEHQLKNAAVVIEVIEVLKQKGYIIPLDAVELGFEQSRREGRFEVLSKKPVFIADGGHNRQCAEAVRDALIRYFPSKDIIFIMGVLEDKDYMSMIECFVPLAERFYTITPNSPRALRAHKLAEALSCFDKPTDACGSVDEAVTKAFAHACEDDVICCVGSLYIIGEIRRAVLFR